MDKETVMDLRTLRYFVTVADELNITRAAEKLHMSQPPLSAQIRGLEKELNTELFIRGGRQLILTESGQLLYRRAKEILNLSDKTQEEVLSMGKGMSGTISIGLVEGMAPDIAAEWFAGFLAEYPNIRLRILDGSTGQVQTDQNDHGAGDNRREETHNLPCADDLEQQRNQNIHDTGNNNTAHGIRQFFSTGHIGKLTNIQFRYSLETA